MARSSQFRFSVDSLGRGDDPANGADLGEGLAQDCGARDPDLLGERAGAAYELSKTGENRVFIRYLSAGGKVGTKTPHLTIGTYEMKRAFAVTTRLVHSEGSVAIPFDHGGVAYRRPRPEKRSPRPPERRLPH